MKREHRKEKLLVERVIMVDGSYSER